MHESAHSTHSWGIFGATGTVGRQSDPSACPSPHPVPVTAPAGSPYPRSPSHQTSPRSRSPGRTSSGWGCSARSHTGTGSTWSSSGLLLGFLAGRGKSPEPQGHLSTAESWEHLRLAQRASPRAAQAHSFLFLPSIPIPHSVATTALSVFFVARHHPWSQNQSRIHQSMAEKEE